jgi:GMP synthase (glutamine-hydrolysing)
MTFAGDFEVGRSRAVFTPPDGSDTIAVIDFGSQYSQLIARRVREAGVRSLLFAWDRPWSEIAKVNPSGIILSGGPASVYDQGAPSLPHWVLSQDVPVLGICYGMQLLANSLDGEVTAASKREYGPAAVQVGQPSPLFKDLPPVLDVWMSHGDYVSRLPSGFTSIASSNNAPIAGMSDGRRFGIQFHPEVIHTPLGRDIIRNFLVNVCHCRTDWTPEHVIDAAVREIRNTVGEGRVLLGLSGGVDSSVAAALIHRAIGDRLTPIFVDNGLLRLDEAETVREVFGRSFGMNLVFVDAADRFLARLQGVVDPEEKRRIVGDQFIRVFESEAERLGPFDFLGQGTLYPDVIESTTPETRAAVKIKTHHNVGGLPADLRFSLVEPLRYLFKDEVRVIGRELGLPAEIVDRQPFPGPGLAVRIIGEVTAADLDLLRRADAIVREEIEDADVTPHVWQCFAVLLPVRTVGVMGDDRSYGRVCAIRAVTSEDGMTADWARLPFEVLARVSNRIVNEVQGITRVVYDVSSKPPATIEWE